MTPRQPATKSAAKTAASNKAPATKPAAAPAAPALPSVSAKPAHKAALKVAVKAPVKLAKTSKPGKTLKLAKPAKVQQKPVRDSFTMPEADFSLVATLKARALAGKRETRKSELLRAGLHALAAMDGPTLLAALHALEPIKTGRPRKGS